MATDGHEPYGNSLLLTALQAAGLCGVGGLVFGGTVGVLRSKTPALWAAATTVQWALLGGTFWAVRSAILQTRQPDDRSNPATKAYCSAVAGTIAFPIIGAVTRGRKNVIPGAIMGTILGYTGQQAYNVVDDWHTASVQAAVNHSAPQSQQPSAPAAAGPLPHISQQPAKQHKPLVQRIGESKWSPFTVLSDDEYANMLREQLLRVEAEIEILDENIAALKRTCGDATASGGSDGEPKEPGLGELDLARRLRDPNAGAVESREDRADQEQVEMARGLRERLKRREG